MEKQVHAVGQLGADRRERGSDLVEFGSDERAGVWVEGEPAVLVRLGVLTDALAAAESYAACRSVTSTWTRA